MKTIHFLKTINIFFAAALSIVSGLATPAAAQEYLIDLNSKKVTDLGTLGERQVTGINDAGQIVGAEPVTGTGSKPPHAFVTGPDGVGLTELGTLGGRYSFGVGIGVNPFSWTVMDLIPKRSLCCARAWYAEHPFQE